VGDGTYGYEWDALNRLIKVELKGAPNVTVAEISYDVMNRRVWREADEDQDGTPDEELIYVWDGWRNIEERDYSTEDLLRDYVYGTYIDEVVHGRSDFWDGSTLGPDGDFADSKEQFYYTTNNLYSVAALIDTSGNVIERYEYLPYGAVTVYTGAGVDSTWFTSDDATSSYSDIQHVTFTGRRSDPESELMYFRNRYYSPELGRFVGRDPLGYVDSLNVYAYAKAQPSGIVDALGESVSVCASGNKYHVNIAGLDANQKDQGYSKVAEKRREYMNRKLKQNPHLGLTIAAAFTTTGPDLVENAAFAFQRVQVHQGVFGVTYFLFFVDFEVCKSDAKDIEIEVKERNRMLTECRFVGGNPKCITKPDPQGKDIDYPRFQPTSTPTFKGVLSERNQAADDGCTHTVIVADAPMEQQFMKDFRAVRRRYRVVSATQIVTLRDKSTGKPVFTNKHRFSIGIGKSGKLQSSPYQP